MSRLRSPLLWVVAFLLTAGTAAYQRMSGPTYPVRGRALVGGLVIPYRLERSWNSGEPLPVRIRAGDGVTGEVLWKRHKSSDPVTTLPLRREGQFLTAGLPTQPPAGKLEYRVRLRSGAEQVVIPPNGPAIMRYKGAVPAGVLVPHIVAMFAGMLVSMRVLLAALFHERLKRLAWAAFVCLALGGGILGPIVQKFAFGAFWTGWPFGGDLTDNKTAVMILAWLVALVAMRGRDGDRRRRGWAIAAALVVVAVYLVPHSMRGSELKWDDPKASGAAKAAAGPPPETGGR